MEDLIGKERHEHRIRHGGEADQTKQRHKGTNRTGSRDELKPFNNIFQRGTLNRHAWTVHLHHRQAGNYREKANAISEEAPAFANGGNHDARKSGPHYARTIEHGRIERNRVHQIGARNHIDDESLACRQINCVDHASKGGQCDDLPDLYAVRKRDPGQDEGKEHHGGLGENQDFSAIKAVRQRPPDGRQQENRDLRGEGHGAQQQG